MSLADWLQPASIQQAVYTPRELARISGLSVDMQRSWRQRGLLPAQGQGHARFTIKEVVEITVRTTLSRAGISPGGLSIDFASAAKVAMFHAVFCRGAVEVIGPEALVNEFHRRFNESHELGESLVGEGPRSSFLVINHDKMEARIVDDAQDLVRNKEEFNSVYNLEGLGSGLIDRGGRPMITVHWPNPTNRRVKRKYTSY